MRYLIVFLISSFFFLIIKILNADIRLSDTNIYFATAHNILQGKMLYKDIFFTNFPLLPYISSFYLIFIKKNLSLYFLTATFEALAVAFFIFLIVKNKTQNLLTGLCCSALYLFSFITLVTSDHQTGVFLASLFAVISYYFYEKKKFGLSGIFISLGILTKAYFIPIFLSYIATFLMESKNSTNVENNQNKIRAIKYFRNQISFFIGFISAAIIVMLPTIIFALSEFINNFFSYSLTRTQGVNKTELIWFFIKHDFVLFLLIFSNLLLFRKKTFFAWLSVFGIGFLFFYQDTYYLYLNFLTPFLCISFYLWYLSLEKKFKLQRLIIPTLLILIFSFNIFIYLSKYKNLQKISDHLPNMISLIKKEKTPVLYGVNDLTPALSILTDVPLLDNQLDTNSNLFRKGFLNAKKLTEKAIKKNALIVAHGAYYPELNIKIAVADEIFDTQQLVKYCKLLKIYPLKNEGDLNIISLIRCQIY